MGSLSDFVPKIFLPRITGYTHTGLEILIEMLLIISLQYFLESNTSCYFSAENILAVLLSCMFFDIIQ